jgi:hypothetical protein
LTKDFKQGEVDVYHGEWWISKCSYQKIVEEQFDGQKGSEHADQSGWWSVEVSTCSSYR